MIAHPRRGEVVLNDVYLCFAEHYQTAIMPAEVRKPSQKSGVGEKVGKIAGKVIGMLRNETFHSLKTLKRGIGEAPAKLHSKEFQKRNRRRKIIDKWSNYKSNERKSKFIYGFIEQRCGNSPAIFVGQYDVADWAAEHRQIR